MSVETWLNISLPSREGQELAQLTFPGLDTTEGSTEALNADVSVSGRWAPSIVIGSPLWLEGEDPSRIEIADRRIAQCRAWVEYYQGVSKFACLLEEAIDQRARLDEDNEANTKPRSSLASIRSKAIAERLELLGYILESSEFPPERANIEAAISGYESGGIPYSSSYTIIWAGQIVDRCSDYASFASDRDERLDRYFAEYGEGWLWYEPPLSGDSGDILRGPSAVLKKGVCLEDRKIWRDRSENMGHYRLTMGFRRRKAAVARETTGAAPRTHKPSSSSRKPSGSIVVPSSPDSDGPRIFFEMLLDSGATLPCIYEDDLAKLQIDSKNYAAQGARLIATAENVSKMRMYELDVGVYAADGSSLVTRDPPIWPSEPDILGGTVPVVALAGTAHSDASPNAAPDRLSGLLPFHVCYWSGTPGSFKLWLGEDRREVLGAGRLPGQMRLAASKVPHNQTPPSLLGARLDWLDKELGTPERVVFEHKFREDADWVLRDTDEGQGSVIASVPWGTILNAPNTKAKGGQMFGTARLARLAGSPRTRARTRRQTQEYQQ
ncbi:hypothetical protein B0H67DRAFT_639809 [Lasiosphaeris hirsuta]|uniref:Uncharacterized protein n=1 Tax=Lasiosphaeris hirsuta TaxID=260670 RepID=A0AA40EBM0_9PEZI|nr:hypothetical protein B0H67DRAFT_639809 [Lasiosphaeris hirsuta]